MNENKIIHLFLFLFLVFIQTNSLEIIDENCIKTNFKSSSEIKRRLTLDKDWNTGVSVRTTNGVVPWVPCPTGYYRIVKNPKLNHREDGCILCPRGRYGSTIGLTSSMCSGPCPRGRYGDFKGASSPDDCALCPFDTYGPTEGSTNPRCTRCPDGFYNPNTGSTSLSACVKCPPNYFGNQCSNQFDIQDEIDLIYNKDTKSKDITSNSNLQTSSQIKKSTYVSKNSGCGGFNNVCRGQHIASLM